MTEDDRAAALVAGLGAALADDPGGGQGAAVAAVAERGSSPGRSSSSTPTCPASSRTTCGRCSGRLRPTAWPTCPRGRRHDECARPARAGASSRPLYGPGSAERFRAHAEQLGATALAVAIPNLADDVDTEADLERVGLRAGPRTQAAIASLGLAA